MKVFHIDVDLKTAKTINENLKGKKGYRIKEFKVTIENLDLLTEVNKKKKVGRKPLPKEYKKDKPVMANFTNDEYKALEILANKKERSISSLVRMAALDLINKTL